MSNDQGWKESEAIPQDVLEDIYTFLARAHFERPQDEAKAAEFGKRIELLRAQRQQGAEPVYQMQAVDGHWVTLDKEHYEGVVNDTTFQTRILYSTPPQANALVAAAYRKAAEICDECVSFKMAEWSSPQARPLNHEEIKSRLLEAIPANAEAALREVCMKVARKASGCGWSLGMESANPKESDLEAIVNSVLGEGKP
jgi:hypothetical protein